MQVLCLSKTIPKRVKTEKTERQTKYKEQVNTTNEGKNDMPYAAEYYR